MKPDLTAQLSRKQREAVESAGYRILRWAAARKILQARVSKARIGEPLGSFLAHWMALASGSEVGAELWLSFDYVQDQDGITLTAGSASLASAPLEQALLHLPALRSFWSQELRRQHFEALQSLVPKAWFLDGAEIPPGAVIQGLEAVSWLDPQLRVGQGWKLQDPRGLIRQDWQAALASRDCVLSLQASAGTKLNVLYGRDDKEQVVVRSLEASP